MADSERVGLVLSGGGARGAYEAGVLSVLAPHLERRGERPSVLVGTSVGAINAAYVAATADLDAGEAIARGLDRWREATKGRVIRPIVRAQLPLNLVRYVGELLRLPGLRLPSLLEPKPLERHLSRWIDWEALHRNVREGRVEAIAVIATAASTGRSVAFVEGRHSVRHRSHVVEYLPAALDQQHVRASAAIPILFPPVRIDAPDEARGWYIDGGTRLDTPIKPALDLGAERLVVISTQSVAEPPTDPGRHEARAPDISDAALHILHGALVDPLVEDLRILGNVNLFFGEPEAAPGATAYRAARGKPPYRTVSYIFIAPPRRGAIGELAMEVFRARYRGLKGLRSPDFPLLNRLLGHDSRTHGELLSYIFFDREFIEELIRMGQQDAHRWLQAPPGPDEPWQLEPLDAFTRAGATAEPRPQEEIATASQAEDRTSDR